jgi:hypothetical protein
VTMLGRFPNWPFSADQGIGNGPANISHHWGESGHASPAHPATCIGAQRALHFELEYQSALGKQMYIYPHFYPWLDKAVKGNLRTPQDKKVI